MLVWTTVLKGFKQFAATAEKEVQGVTMELG